MTSYKVNEAAAVLGVSVYAFAAVLTLVLLGLLLSGALITSQGWTWLNLGSLLPLTLVGGALWWLSTRRREAVGAP